MNTVPSGVRVYLSTDVASKKGHKARCSDPRRMVDVFDKLEALKAELVAERATRL